MAPSDYHDALWLATGEGVGPPAGWQERAAFLQSLIRPNDRVLDLGCGEGRGLVVIARAGGRPIGADPSAVALERAARRCPAAELVPTEVGGPLPLADASADGVWLSEVLNQVADTGGLLDESRRVLRPGGWLGVTVPAHGRRSRLVTAMRGGEDPESVAFRHYTRSSLVEQLGRHRFADTAVRVAGPRGARMLLASACRPPSG